MRQDALKGFQVLIQTVYNWKKKQFVLKTTSVTLQKINQDVQYIASVIEESKQVISQ